jgi:flagellar biosynthesis/type III secretory pathway ATPase
VRGILDGHIVLSRQLGAAGHYPAIDVLNSVSRLQSQLSTPDQKKAASILRESLTAYQQAEDLVQLGAYVSGSNPRLDRTIQLRSQILQFLCQEAETSVPLDEALGGICSLAGKLGM